MFHTISSAPSTVMFNFAPYHDDLLLAFVLQNCHIAVNCSGNTALVYMLMSMSYEGVSMTNCMELLKYFNNVCKADPYIVCGNGRTVYEMFPEMMVRYHDYVEKEERKDYSISTDDVVHVNKRAKQEN